MTYLLYEIVLYLSALFLVPYYLMRGLKYGKARHGIRERLGVYRQDLRSVLHGKTVIWVHAVSVGETRAAIPLLKGLRREYPEAILILSNVTETGRKIAAKIEEIDHFVFFPFDLRWIVRKVFNIIQPSLIILVETEIWPNFVLEAKDRKIPIILVNGRISDRSFPRYRRLKKIMLPVLESLSAFCMQSEQDSRRIRHLGAATGRVEVTGNLKFDMQSPEVNTDDIPSLRALYKLPENSTIWVAGSTHDGEEAEIVNVYQRLRESHQSLVLIVVPRHPERSRQLFEDLARRGVSASFRSELSSSSQTLRPGEILIVDTLGEMLKLYAVSDLVFVGGSLVPVGGHNILEASLMKKPVLFGPYMQNFKEIARLVRAAHGGLQVKDTEDLYRQMKLLLDNPSEAERIGDNGKYLIEANQGATDKTLRMIARYFD